MTDVISTAPLPADVRAAGAHGRQLYTAALGFEQTLVRTLASQLAADRHERRRRRGGRRRRRRPHPRPDPGRARRRHRLERRPRPRARALPLDEREGSRQMSAIVAHLDKQVESARRLLGIVIEQSAAIRDQDVETVLVKMAELQGEMVTRAQLEQERDHLIQSAATPARRSRRRGRPRRDAHARAARRPARARPLGRAQGPRHRDLAACTTRTACSSGRSSPSSTT